MVDTKDSKEQLILNLIMLSRRVMELEKEKGKYERQFAEANAMFESLFEFATDAVLLIDREKHIIRVNAQTEKMFGYSRQELVGKQHDILLPQRFLERHKENMKGYMASPRIRLMKSGVELYGRKKDGSEFPVDISLGPLTDEEDSIILSVVRDISEYYRQNEALLESEERYRKLVEMAPDGIIIQSEGTLVFANNKAATIFGAELPEQLIGKSIWQFVHPEYKEIVEKRFRTMTEEVKGVPLIEEKIIRLDGTPIVVEVVSAPFSYRGKVATQSWFRDITWRKQAEQALQESEERYRQIVEHSPLSISIHAGGKVIFANSTTLSLFGVESQEQIVGKPVFDFIHPDFRQLSLERIKTMMVDKKPAPIIEEKFLRMDGTTFIGETISLPSTYGGQHVIITWIHDITRDREAQDKLKHTMADLERSNKELEQFAYAASHDLREPLRMMVSFSQFLEKRYKDKLDKEGVEFVSFIVDGATRMSHMIDDLLEYSRVGRLGKPFAPVNCDKSLDEAMSYLKLATEESGAIIEHDTLPTIFGDSSQIVRLFQNLISNAIKFRKEIPPRVYISAQKKEGEWVFSIKDNGIGIAPEHSGRLFALFGRIHMRGEYTGTGIGLATCKKIVERHGGRIWVESEPGKGSTFYFTIPAGG